MHFSPGSLSSCWYANHEAQGCAPETLDHANTLDEIGGRGEHIKVLAPFERPT
jgi:hypothetical protein